MVSWGPSAPGLIFTKSDNWRVSLHEGQIIVITKTIRRSENLSKDAVSVTPGLLWSSIQVRLAQDTMLTLDGIPNEQAANMKLVFDQAYLAILLEAEKAKQLKKLDTLLAVVRVWCDAVSSSFTSHKKDLIWITHQTVTGWQNSIPVDEKIALAKLLKIDYMDKVFAAKDETTRASVRLMDADLLAIAREQNQALLKTETITHKQYFDTVEKSPLTDEQIKSVICFDNRVLTIASAGSGKTSTMVAKAGYALRRQFFTADKILLLAFNKDAADELKQRAIDRLGPLGLKAESIVAMTFHAFGAYVIGQATQKKPTPAPWVTNGKDIAHLSKLIDELKDKDKAFRVKWDMFRVVFSRDLPKFGKEDESHDDWNPKVEAQAFPTLNNEVVKSQGERLIADWLFYNGVEYIYEPAYEHPTVTADRRQYYPDFYYPQIKLYHEHFALDKNGNAPPEFEGYMDGVVWKRQTHRQYKTSLMETTSADIRSGHAFDILEVELTKRGIKLDPNPDRPAKGGEPIEHEQLVRKFRTFLTHVKSNALTHEDLTARVVANGLNNFAYRHTIFLDLFKDIRKAWDDSLKAMNFIDFEDMLNMASGHLEKGKWKSPFELVMVDEFQDASHARARMASALVKQPGRFLFAVGDDWQSINRFAGSDISVMTDFEKKFGEGEIVKLERTFRCPQSLCDISSNFVSKNKAQLKKKVASNRPEFAPPLQVFQVQSDKKIQESIHKVLAELCEGIESGAVARANKGLISVFVLGRYKKDDQFIPVDWKKDFGKFIDLRFSTMHGSKGLEADYVILPRMVNKYSAFPSTIEDDPVLQLAMPSGDDYPYAEERRLFYVALTRARRSVTIFTVDRMVSPFVLELIKDLKLEVRSMDRKKSKVVKCPKCKTGTLKTIPGQYGDFIGCTAYPACKHTVKIPKAAVKTQRKNS